MKKSSTKPDKHETLLRLAHAVFALEVSKGHLAWKVTDLVRKSGCSRTLIYRYLGSSREEMLSSILDFFLTEFYGLSSKESEVVFSEQVRIGRAFIQENPEAALFYIRWRTKESKLSGTFAKVEKRFLTRLKKLFPDVSETDLIARHAVMHGLITAPFLSADQAAEIYRNLFE